MSTPGRCTAGCRGGGATVPPTGPRPLPRVVELRDTERAELERLRREMSEKNKRIRELEMERDVFKRCMALWVK